MVAAKRNADMSVQCWGDCETLGLTCLVGGMGGYRSHIAVASALYVPEVDLGLVCYVGK